MIEVPPATTDPFYRQELLGHIQAVIDEHPRSAQAQVGPSEIGGCQSKLAWKLAYGGESNRQGGWAAHKGSVLHGWLDQAVFSKGPSLMPDGTQRWHSDMKLNPVCEWVNGGTLDLYDRLQQCVIDFKLPGQHTMDSVRGGKLSVGYFIQSQVYGLGLEKMGYPISKTALLFLPMAGDDIHGTARGAVLRIWDYDRTVAEEAIERVAATKRLIDKVGPQEAIAMLPKMSDFCSSCPAHASSHDRRAVCPGVTGRAISIQSADPFR